MGLLDRLRRLLGGDDAEGEVADRRPGDRAVTETGADTDGDRDATPSRDDRATDSGADAGTGGGDESAATGTDDGATDRREGPGESADDDGDGRDENRGGDGPGGGSAPVARAVGDDPAAFREQATELADFWGSYDLDFTPASLPRLDALLADQRESAGHMRVELDDGRTATVAPIAASTACYFAETMRRAYDADWVADEDYRWALAVPTPGGGEVRLNAFGIASDGLTDAPRFAVVHDALVAEVGLDGDTVADPQAEAAAARTGSAVTDAEDLAAVAADDPEVAMAAAAAGIDADELVAGFEEDAETLVADWPAYDLDYTPESLERVDALVRTEFETEGFADATFGGTEDRTSLLFTVRAMQTAGYLASVFRRHADAEWDTGDGLTLAVEGPDGDAEVDPLRTAVAALRESESLAATYDGVVSRLGLTDAGVDVDPDAPEFAPPVEDGGAADAPGADSDVPGADVALDVGPEDVEVDLDPEDLDVDVTPDDGETDEGDRDGDENADGTDGDR